MQYAIRHISQFEYDRAIRESVMEVRVCPRTEEQQHCYSHDLSVTPRAQIFSYQDSVGNIVHHFDIPEEHDRLVLESRALVEVHSTPDLPEALPAGSWDELDRLVEDGNHVEMVLPSRFARPTEALRELAGHLGIERRDDPLTLLREANEGIYGMFEYSPRSTHVNSPIDDALRQRRGVCQDFAHIMIALMREVRIPCRYVSGYLYHRHGIDGNDGDRSAEDGSHAWVEAFLPELGWIGFDPTNNVVAGERHIRVALGTDYASVPPTRGIYRGDGRSTLRVGVHVAKSSFFTRDDRMPELTPVTLAEDLAREHAAAQALQQ